MKQSIKHLQIYGSGVVRHLKEFLVLFLFLDEFCYEIVASQDMKWGILNID